MSELFDEVDEEVRREQLKKLWDKYSIYIIGAALLVIAGVGGWRGYQYLEAKKAAQAGEAFNKAIELSEQSKHEEAEAAFADLAARAPAGYRVLARFRAAAEAASRDPKSGAKMFDDIVTDRTVTPDLQALARIRAAGLLVDSASYAEMKQRLEPDTTPGATFRHSARELLALSAWRSNDATATRQWLDMIALDADAPPGLRQRAEALQALLPPVAKSQAERSDRETLMRRSQRLIAATVLVALGGVLGGCSSGNFEPSDLLDFLDTKKKLPGERKAVFPDGVPGLEQGVPKELYKGAQPQQEEQNAQAATPAAAPTPEQPAPRTKQARAKRSKPFPTASGAPDSSAAEPEGQAKPAEDTAPAAQVAKGKKLAHRPTTPPPESSVEQSGPSAQSPQPAQSAQQSSPPFPAPLPSGSFTR